MTVFRAVVEVHDALNNIDVQAIAALDEQEMLTCWSVVEDLGRVVQVLRSELTREVAQRMGDRQVTVDGVGTFIRRLKRDRTAWQKDDLLRVVLDSRVVDETTGEIMDETPLQKVLAVWNLGAPRTTVLRDRGIDPDEFCHVERGGWTIQQV